MKGFHFLLGPIRSMYGIFIVIHIFTYIWLIVMVNLGEHNIHGCYGFGTLQRNESSQIVVTDHDLGCGNCSCES